MSRTDKDVPWRVRAEWYHPLHQFCQFDVGRRSWYCPPEFRDNRRICDLPPAPRRGHDHPSRFWARRREYHCTWEPEYPQLNRYRYTRPPTREEKRLGWWGPDRRRVRDQVRESIKEFRGTGDIEVVVSTSRHRHCSMKGWWD